MDGNTLELTGYSIEVLPREDKTALYRHKDGRVVRLPDNPYSRRHYLMKGLVLYTGITPVVKRPRGRPRKSKKEVK